MNHTLVILHGWGLSKKRFEPLIDVLQSEGFTVRALDFPGFGESKSPEKPYTLDDYASFLCSYLKNEHIKYPILIGHSFGGRVALRFSSMYPESVRALILSGTPGYTPVSRKKLLLFITIAKIGKSVLSLPTLSFLSDFLRKWYYYLVGAKEYYRAKGTMRQTFKNVVSELLVEDMKRVNVPTALIWGELDIIVPVNIAIKMRDTIRGSELHMIHGADHGVPYKQPHKFSKQITSFLKNHVQ